MELLKMTFPGGATLTAYLHEDSVEMPHQVCKKRPAMLVCPGGGYVFLSEREMEPPAMAFYNMGMQVFVLKYSIGPDAADKRPLEQAARSMKTIRESALKWNIDPEKVLIMGFSAGGHLACSMGVHWNDPEIAQRVDAECSMLRPSGMVLCYPVITAGEFAHVGSIETVSANSTEPMEYWSLETQVDSQTPPTFLWHTMVDDCVPVENAFLFASALHKAGVGCECHIFANGGHGMATCTKEVGTENLPAQRWVSLCRTWIEGEFGPLAGL